MQLLAVCVKGVFLEEKNTLTNPAQLEAGDLSSRDFEPKLAYSGHMDKPLVTHLTHPSCNTKIFEIGFMSANHFKWEDGKYSMKHNYQKLFFHEWSHKGCVVK